MPNPQQKQRQELEVQSALGMVDKRGSGSSKAVKWPEGLRPFGIKKAGLYRLDFLVFYAGAGNPFAPGAGKLHFERTFFTHRDVGPAKSAHTCLAKTFNEPCAPCEHRANLAVAMAKVKDEQEKKDYEQLIRALKPSERQLFLVFDRDNPQLGLQGWDFSEFLFGQYLRKKLERTRKDPKAYYLFAHPTKGYTLHIGAEKSAKGDWYECNDIEFHPREYPIPDEVIDMALGIQLDQCVVHHTYAELSDAYYQRGGEEPEEEAEVEDYVPETPVVEEQPEIQQAEEIQQEQPTEEPVTSVEQAEEIEQQQVAEEQQVEETPTEEQTLGAPEATAFDYGFEVGEFVDSLTGKGRCEIIKITQDGKFLTLEDKEGAFHKAIEPNEIAKIKKATVPAPAPKPAPSPPPAAKKPVVPPPAARPATPSKDDEDIPFQQPTAVVPQTVRKPAPVTTPPVKPPIKPIPGKKVAPPVTK